MSTDPQRELLRAALARTPECPDIEVLTGAAPGSPTAVHAETCPRCRAELALLHQFETAQAAPGEVESLAYVESELTRRRASQALPPAVPPARTPWKGWRMLTWAAACVAIAVIVSVYERPGDTGAVKNIQPVYRSTRITGLSPTGDLSSAPTELRWEAVPAAAGYRIRILEVDGKEIWNTATTENHVAVSEALAPRLTPGRAVQWDVVALDAASRRLGASDLQTIHILATHR
jgi:hypothetical protein